MGRVYAVKRGWKTGVFGNWNDCLAAVRNYDKPKYRKFEDRNEAIEWLRADERQDPKGGEFVFVPPAQA